MLWPFFALAQCVYSWHGMQGMVFLDRFPDIFSLGFVYISHAAYAGWCRRGMVYNDTDGEEAMETKLSQEIEVCWQ